MKAAIRMGSCALLPLLAMGMGCATAVSRDQAAYQRHPHVYPSTRLYTRGESPPVPYENETLTGWNIYPSPRSMCVSCASVPYLLLVDLPVSMISDTVMLPVDLANIREYKGHANFFIRFLEGEGDIPSAQEIKTKYVASYCDAVIREYLIKNDKPVSPERIEALADAGVALPLIAESTKTPDAVLRSFAQTKARNILKILAENPSLPDDVVLALAGEVDDVSVLVRLASREGLGRDAQAVLARNRELRVREALVVNPSLAPAVLYDMARDAKHWRILRKMALLQNCDEEVYMALAAKEDQATLEYLARNKSMSEAVLVKILENAEDGVARTVLQHPQASLATKEKALDTIKNRQPRDKVRYGTLAENRVVGGIEYLAGTRLSLHDNGQVRSGTLASDRTIDGIGFTRGQRVTFLKTGDVDRRAIASPVVINGIPCSPNVEFYDSGKLRFTVLSEDAVVNGVNLPAGSRLHFYESGSLRTAGPVKEVEVKGIACRARAQIKFYESGGLKSAILAREQRIGGVVFPRGSVLQLDASGALEKTPTAGAYRMVAKDLHRQGRLADALRMYGYAVQADPGDARARLQRAEVMEKLGDYAGALADYERAYEERSEDPNILNRLAWSLATCPDGRYRDGQRAVRLAQQAVELARCGPTLDTLAAACAEVGDFEQAVRQQEEAIAAVVEEGREELLEEFKERLLGYKAGEPWRAGQ